MRLYVGPLCIENLFQPFDGDSFALVYYFATSIIALTGISFCVFVGQTASHGLHDLVADKVLGSDQLNAFQLALVLLLDNVKNDVVSFHYLLNWLLQ